MANTFRNEIFRPLQTLSYLTVGLLGGMIVCGVLFIVFSFVMVLNPDSMLDLGDGEFMQIGYGFIGLVTLLNIPLYLATVVFFLIWQYRAFNNLSALNAQNLEFSPGWALGWWFIPFANFVKPFQVMRELWVGSDPEFDPDFGFFSSVASAPTIMGFWWGAWILTNITGNIVNRMDGSDYFPTFMIVASLFRIASAGLLIIIIFDINKRQQLRFQNIDRLQPAIPPPPPTFN